MSYTAPGNSITDQFEATDTARRAAGSFRGNHHTTYVVQVKELKRAGDLAAAVRLLLRMVDAVEAESRVAGPHWPVPPWCYEQLAGIHRKAKNYRGEVDILTRYVTQHVSLTEPPYPAVLARLDKAMDLAQQSTE